MDKSIKIIVATHKPYWMPDDPMYLPVQVGAEGKTDLGYQPDNIGDHISEKNASFCELTGLYWAWKNQEADYLGLVHYRRYFANPHKHREHDPDNRSFLCLKRNDRSMRQPPTEKQDRILTQDVAEQLLENTDVLLPKKRHYWIETNYSQYVHAHHETDLEMTRWIIEERYPQYLQPYDKVMIRSSGHRFNMFIMKREILDQYCSWLFHILFELEQRLDISNYSVNDKRVFGFVAERLLDVWIEKNEIPYQELPHLFLENQNWVKKIVNFTVRKIKGNIVD